MKSRSLLQKARGRHSVPETARRIRIREILSSREPKILVMGALLI